MRPNLHPFISTYAKGLGIDSLSSVQDLPYSRSEHLATGLNALKVILAHLFKNTGLFRVYFASISQSPLTETCLMYYQDFPLLKARQVMVRRLVQFETIPLGW